MEESILSSESLQISLKADGERFIPSKMHGSIELEHFHRYRFACQLVDGKVVLDIASGEGYGSAYMAQFARHVIGVDISKEAVDHARQKYSKENLKYYTGTCLAIPVESGSVDIVVSFETIEHHREHDDMMREIKRVLVPGGILVISSPDKLEYSDKPGFHNPFHVKELYAEEFHSLLAAYFRNVHLYGQRVLLGSALLNSADSGNMVFQQIDSDSLSVSSLPDPLYWVAVASDEKLPETCGGIFEQPMADVWRKIASKRDVKSAELINALATPNSNQLKAQLRSLWYLQQNPDIVAAGVDPFEHWKNNGIAEGRMPSPDPVQFALELVSERELPLIFDIEKKDSELRRFQVESLERQRELETEITETRLKAQNEVNAQLRLLAERERTFGEQYAELQRVASLERASQLETSQQQMANIAVQYAEREKLLVASVEHKKYELHKIQDEVNVQLNLYAERERVFTQQLIQLQDSTIQERLVVQQQAAVVLEQHIRREELLLSAFKEKERQLQKLLDESLEWQRLLEEEITETRLKAKNEVNAQLRLYADREQAFTEQLDKLQESASQERLAQMAALAEQYAKREKLLLAEIEEKECERRKVFNESLEQERVFREQITQVRLKAQEEMNVQLRLYAEREQAYAEKLIELQQVASQERAYLKDQYSRLSGDWNNWIKAIQSSWSWRMTAPFRALALFFGIKSILKTPVPQELFSVSTNDEQIPVIHNHETVYQKESKSNACYPSTTTILAAHTLDELLSYDTDAFVRCAYLTLLGREPDQEGFIYYRERLKKSCDKLGVIFQIYKGQEAIRFNSNIAGLHTAMKRQKWIHFPVIRAVVTLFIRKGKNDNKILSVYQARDNKDQRSNVGLTQDECDKENIYSDLVKSIDSSSEILDDKRNTITNKKQAIISEISSNPRFYPAHDLSLDTSIDLSWLSQGGDPYFYIDLTHNIFDKDAWCAINLCIHSEWEKGVAKFYIDSGYGYNENNVLVVPYRSDEQVERLFKITTTISGIRFDPLEGKGKFRIDTLQFKLISEFNAMQAMAARLAVCDSRFNGKCVYEIIQVIEDMDVESNNSFIQRLSDLYSKTFIINLSNIDYEKWIKEIEKQKLSAEDDIEVALEKVAKRPLISVVMPTYNTPEMFLRQSIESVINQSYKNWELCIADDASENPEVRLVLDEYMRNDVRIRVIYRTENGHISRASNSALEIARGDYVALLDHDDVLANHALFYMILAIDAFPSAKVLYSDEDKIDSNGNRFDPHFKSDWNPDLFYAQNYVSHLGVYRRDLLQQINGFRFGLEGSQDQDLLLRCLPYTKSTEIIHIPRVLYHWRAVSGSTAMDSSEKTYTTIAGIKALTDYFNNNGLNGVTVEGERIPNTYRIHWPVPNPELLVSLLIPVRDKRELTENCVRSILDKSSYKNFEILILDNGSIEPETLDFLNIIQQEDRRVRVLNYNHPFNYSAINNFGVKHAQGDIVGLVNNDVEVISSDWLSEMVSHVCRAEIGCVGAKLYYGDETIQHAGVICGLGGIANHSHKHYSKNSSGYFCRLITTQNYLAVTAACLLVRKAVFQEVGGLDEKNLTIAFNDVDFCLKVRAAGYRNLWTPYAELYHHESISRGVDNTIEKQMRFQNEVEFMKNKWGEILKNDPYYSVNLTREFEDFSIGINIDLQDDWYSPSIFQEQLK